MAAGADAVKFALAREFGALIVDEGYDANTQEVLLDFTVNGRDFRVRVSREYDNDYASGQLRVDLRGLGALLLASKDSKARVTCAGISSQPDAQMDGSVA